MLSASIKYDRPRTDKAVRLAIAFQTEKVLTSYGIHCDGKKNGAFVKYLGIIGKLMNLDFDAYTLARDTLRGWEGEGRKVKLSTDLKEFREAISPNW